MRLVLFTNTYPFLPGETFLDDELPILKNFFNEFHIVPLHKGNSVQRPLPEGIVLEEPLLNFSPKDKLKMLWNGIFTTAPLFGGPSYMLKRVRSFKQLRTIFTFWLLRRSMYSKFSPKTRELDYIGDTLIYFYWGDKSIMLVPVIKHYMPAAKIVSRFHGSDLYEEVPGIIPFRESILPLLDLAVPISDRGEAYFKKNYVSCMPKRVQVSKLGVLDYKFKDRFIKVTKDPVVARPEVEIAADRMDKVFNLFSCSNVIPLKRVGLILKALQLITPSEIKEFGYDYISWVHIGGGSQLDSLQAEVDSVSSLAFQVNLLGVMEHADVVSYYHSTPVDLFIQLSTSEGIPVSMMEALCFETPIVATNVGGVSEIVNSEVGELLPSDPTPQEVKAAIMKFISMSEEERQRYRANARRSFEQNWNANENFTSFAALLSSL